MKINKISFFLPILFIGLLHAEPVPVGQLKFDGGYNPSKLETDIADNESKDMCNCIVESDGGLTKRRGSEKYIQQAQSTSPVKSLYRYYTSSGSASNKTLIAVIDKNVFHSTGGVNPLLVNLSSSIVPGDRWNWVTINNLALGCSPNNTIKRFDLNNSSFTDLITLDGSTNPVILKANYGIMSKNYYIVGNVNISTELIPLIGQTTYYPSRIYYSLIGTTLTPQMTRDRYIEYRSNDGEQITGLGSQFDRVNIFKPSSIGELSFNVLNLPSLGGDWSLSEVVTDFGLEAPQTLAKRGGYYILGTKEGIRQWDGGRHGRATAGEETSILSREIQTLIEKLIRSGTYRNSVGKYYPKRDWYVLSYTDPDKFPKDRNNSVIIYDFKLGKWFPFCNLLAESLEVFTGAGDNGELIYGNSMDSLIYSLDVKTRNDDAAKELIVDTMDSSVAWISSQQDTTNVIEGTSSLKISNPNAVSESSMTLVKVIPLSYWNDKTVTNSSDKLTFKIFPQGVSKISSLRIDLEVNQIDENTVFDTNFTSVTLTSAAFSSDSTWNYISVSLSSFPIRPDWVDLNTENAPFANTQNYYGLRFVLNSIDRSTVSIDDVRLVQASNNPIKFSWTSKMFNFGTMESKNFGQIILTYLKTPESNLKYDIFNNFGDKIRSDSVERKIPQELFVTGFASTSSLTALSSIDFSVIRSTTFNPLVYRVMNGAADEKNIVLVERISNGLMKMKRDNFGLVDSTYGSLGTGTTNFNVPHQIDIRGDSIFAVDLNNHRIKEHSLNDLSFIKQLGELGSATTDFHVPSGIQADDAEVTVSDEGNYAIKNLSISTFGYLSQANVDFNTIGDSTLEEDESYKYMAYERLSDQSLDLVDVVLEKRIKTTNELVNRVVVKKMNSVSVSTYGICGDLALIGNYIYIAFTDDVTNPNRSYFIQKRLREDFSLVSEISTSNKIYSLIGYAKSYIPYRKTERLKIGTQGTYFQVRFYDDSLDNYFKLFNQTILLNPQGITY